VKIICEENAFIRIETTKLKNTCKSKFFRVDAKKAQRGSREYPVVNSAPEDGWLTSRLGRFTPEKISLSVGRG
jgi:hypothetical protein